MISLLFVFCWGCKVTNYHVVQCKPGYVIEVKKKHVHLPVVYARLLQIFFGTSMDTLYKFRCQVRHTRVPGLNGTQMCIYYHTHIYTYHSMCLPF